MKKLFVILILTSIFVLTSCSQSVAMNSQEMPPTEKEWADTISNWYPNWQAPIVILKK